MNAAQSTFAGDHATTCLVTLNEQDELQISSLIRRNPIELVVTGISAALATVVVLCVGKFKLGPLSVNLLRVRSLSVRAFALGTTSHGIGAARALQVDAEAGAYAGIALGLQVLLASLLLPLAFML